MSASKTRNAALSDTLANRIAKSIADAVPTVQRTYVFGSQARGDATKDNDIDLYLVIESAESWREEKDAAIDARLALKWLRTPKDILVASEKDFISRSNRKLSLESIVRNEGMVICG